MIKVNNQIIELGHFPDGTLAAKAPRVNEDLRVCITWNYENDSELFAVACLRKHFAGCKVDLYLPYIPHARMDRVKNEEDIFTLKYFCEIINSLNFNKVFVFDPHSNVSTALLNNVVAHLPYYHISAAWRMHRHNYDNNTAVFFPDEGAMKRYSEMIKAPYAFGIKKRNWEDGKILGLTVMESENIVGKHVLIIDDICSRGGTFYYSAKALLEAGAASVSLYITHCENTITQGDIFNNEIIKEIYTTDSLVHCEDVKNRVIYV